MFWFSKNEVSGIEMMFSLETVFKVGNVAHDWSKDAKALTPTNEAQVIQDDLINSLRCIIKSYSQFLN